jgi:hypothetical protein
VITENRWYIVTDHNPPMYWRPIIGLVVCWFNYTNSKLWVGGWGTRFESRHAIFDLDSEIVVQLDIMGLTLKSDNFGYIKWRY